MHENDIINKCFDPKSHAILAAYEEEKQTALSSDIIKGQIIYEFTQTFEDKLSKKVPSTSGEFYHMVLGDNEEINDILLDRLIDTMGIHTKGSNEYTLTYLTKFDTIIRQFIKELENSAKKHHVGHLIFKERSGADLKKYLMDIYKDIITNAVNELDRSKQWTEYDVSIKEFFIERKYIDV